MNSPKKTNEQLIYELEQLQIKYEVLLKASELKEKSGSVQIKSLFNIFPIAISENDFSEVNTYFNSLKAKGINDLKEYFKSHQHKRAEVLKLMQMVKLVDLNQSHFNLYNVTKEQYIELIPYIFSNYDDEQVNEYINQFAALASGQLVYKQEMPPHKTINGQTKHVISYLQVAPGFEHDLSKIYVVYFDVTERKEAEGALRESELKLKELNSNKDRFISILAHDLRSPFSSILGFLKLLESNVRNYDIDTIETQIKLVSGSTQRVFYLLEDILMWVNSQSGKLPFEPQIFRVKDIVEEILTDIKPSLNIKNIAIDYSEEENVQIFADLNMIKTVFRNLVSNAIKFSKRNGIIHIYATENQREVTVTISDTGIGISQDTVKKLFDQNQNISSEGTAKEKGVGLGLVICKEFIETHKGRIWVESTEGRGSDFKFTIPVHEEI